MQKIFIRVINVVTFILLSVVLLVNVTELSRHLAGGIKMYFVMAAILLGIVLFIIFGGSLFNALKKLFGGVSNLSSKKMMLILFAFVSITKIALVFLLNKNVTEHDDMNHYVSFATQLADNGVITEETLYAGLHPYTFFFGAFFVPFVKLFGSDVKVFTVVLSLLFAVVCVLLFDIIKKYTGKNKAFCGIMLYNILPIGLFQTQVVIHETLLLFFWILSLWLFLKSLEENRTTLQRVIFLLLSGVLIAFGSKVNAIGLVVIISYIIYSLIYLFKDKITIKKALDFAVIIVCYALCFVIVSGICSVFISNVIVHPDNEKTRNERIVDNTVPMAWIAYLGGNYKEAGTWNREDWTAYQKYYDMTDAQEAKDYQTDLVKDRWNELLSDPIKIPSHFWNKCVEQWRIPMLGFVYGGGGNEVNEVLLHFGNNIIYRCILLLCYLTNIMIISVILFSFFNKKKRAEGLTPEYLFKLFFIGIVLSLIMFEMNHKYVVNTYIVFTVLAIFSADAFTEQSYRVRNRLKIKKNKTIG